MLLSACFLLAGLGATSKTFAARIGSPHPLPSTSSALSSKNYVASHPGPARRLDEQGNQPPGHLIRAAAPAKHSSKPARGKWRLVLAWIARRRCIRRQTEHFLRPAKDSACLLRRRLRNIPSTEPQSVSCVSTQRNPECWRVEKDQQYENI